jgi:hypothetical protein
MSYFDTKRTISAPYSQDIQHPLLSIIPKTKEKSCSIENPPQLNSIHERMGCLTGFMITRTVHPSRHSSHGLKRRWVARSTPVTQPVAQYNNSGLVDITSSFDGGEGHDKQARFEDGIISPSCTHT